LLQDNTPSLEDKADGKSFYFEDLLPPKYHTASRKFHPDFIESMTTHIHPPMKWDEDACDKLKDIPWAHLKRIVTGVAERAHSRGLTTVTADFIAGIHIQKPRGKL
jgi:hypothetical protein